ncbi:oxygen-independent coproporphyrinogen III oxidase [uncultured Microscilla sp.]|uniref:oxygen-independent coproporphyrinogen III oxidase n=1 Tax=uncultured Microscilla sp. TaxID=432653 RepID=UPI00262A36E7|nr:oxygen-independent coproporphyrinogen III oxidase [uncultured Microscilla sp.]
MNKHLIDKYNIPAPRYTSYPTVPFWENERFSAHQWKQSVARSFSESNPQEGISLYIHLPFCESLCTFCGCNKRITKNHQVERPYLETVLKEWQMYKDLFDTPPRIKEMHLGGGSPTFFSAQNLGWLIEGILKGTELDKEPLFSFEGNPNNTTNEHLQVLYNLGFRRVSYGIQDYDLNVQKAIRRVQPYEQVQRAHEQSKAVGYTSINHDLVYGLPLQTLESVLDTIRKTEALAPDRIAFYSYAHVPWVKGSGQRGYSEADLPKSAAKRQLYEEGRQLLESGGYREIGLDHFSLSNDDLYQALEEKRLHRNFMGYTSSKTQLMVGLGVSSISDSWYAFAQNVKKVEEYQHLVNAGELPVFRGHHLNTEDLIIRQHILNLMCQLETSWTNKEAKLGGFDGLMPHFEEFEKDGLINVSNEGIKIKAEGRPFIRNICMAFDARLWRNKPETRIFSMAI